MFRDLIFAILIMLALSVALVYPGAAGMSDAAAGGSNEKIWTDLWRYDAIAHLSDRPAPPEEQGLWGPRDILRLQGGFLLPALVAPVTRHFGVVFAHNLAAVIALFLSCVGAYFLFLKLTTAHAPSLIAAVLFGCGPFGAAALREGRPEQAAAFAMPLAALLILWKPEKYTWVRIPAAAALVAVSALIDSQLAAGALLFLFALPLLVAEKKRAVLRDGAIAALIAAPVVIGVLYAAVKIKNAIILPPPTDILSMLIYGRLVTVPAFLCLCAILAHGVRRLLIAGEKVNLSEPIIGRILVALAVVFCLLTSGVKATLVAPPTIYHFFETNIVPGGILELTYEKDRHKNWHVLYYQTIHRKPVHMSDFAWSRPPDAMLKNPFLDLLLDPGKGGSPADESNLRKSAAELRSLGISHFMIHRGKPEAALAEWISQQVLGNPIHQDAFGSLFLLP